MIWHLANFGFERKTQQRIFYCRKQIIFFVLNYLFVITVKRSYVYENIGFFLVSTFE